MIADRQDRPSSETLRDDAGVMVAIIERWKLIIIVGLVLAGITVGVSFLMTPRYESETVVAVVEQSNQSSALASVMARVGGLASLAGLGSSAPAKEEAIARLRSREFSLDVVKTMGLESVLFSERWDQRNADWTAGEEPPSGMELFERFDTDVRSIRSDAKTGLVRVSVRLPDPDLATRVVNQLVARFNDLARNQAIEEAEYRIDYLTREAETASVISLRQELFSVIEFEIQTLAVAKSRRDFALRVIDPAFPADLDKPASPNRPLLGFLGLMLGLFGVSAFIAFKLAFRRLLAPS